MAFLRTKKIKGIRYLYRVESYREGGLPRQRVIAYLGRASGAAKTRATPKAKPKARTESGPRKKPPKPAGETGRRHMAKGKKEGGRRKEQPEPTRAKGQEKKTRLGSRIN